MLLHSRPLLQGWGALPCAPAWSTGEGRCSWVGTYQQCYISQAAAAGGGGGEGDMSAVGQAGVWAGNTVVPCCVQRVGSVPDNAQSTSACCGQSVLQSKGAVSGSALSPMASITPCWILTRCF
jgi:hypothetical protein